MKTIKVGEFFNSFEEFQPTLEIYNKETFQNFVKRSSHPLDPDAILALKSLPIDRISELINNFKFKDLILDCKHAGSVKKNELKKGEKTNTFTTKIGCCAHIRVNFDVHTKTKNYTNGYQP